MLDASEDFSLIFVQVFQVILTQTLFIEHVFERAFLAKRAECLSRKVFVLMVFQLSTHIKSDQNLCLQGVVHLFD